MSITVTTYRTALAQADEIVRNNQPEVVKAIIAHQIMRLARYEALLINADLLHPDEDDEIVDMNTEEGA